MAELFTDEWMKSFLQQWNAEPELSDALSQIGFNSVIGYGYPMMLSRVVSSRSRMARQRPQGCTTARR